MMAGFYPSTFVYSCFPPKIQFLQYLLSSVVLWGGTMVDTKRKMFQIQICRLLENAFFLDFSWNFRVYAYMQVPFMHVCKYLNQRVKRIGEQNGKSFKGVSKTKKKKQHIKRLSFINQFKVEFLLLFTSCRKVLGKMPGWTFFKKIDNIWKQVILFVSQQITTIMIYIYSYSRSTSYHFYIVCILHLFHMHFNVVELDCGQIYNKRSILRCSICQESGIFEVLCMLKEIWQCQYRS